MNTLAELRSYLLGLGTVPAEQVESWVEGMDMVLSGKDTGGGIKLVEVRYQTVINIERWPHAQVPVEILLAHLASWVMDRGERFDEDERPQLEVDINDDDTADIEISLVMLSDIYVKEDSQGSIEAFGKRWTITDKDVPVAEQAGVYDA